jgi:RND family efflux transporter MFP subunit
MRRNVLIAVAAIFILAVALKAVIKSEKITAVSIADVMKKDGTPVDVVEVQPKRLELWRAYSGALEGEKQGMLFAEASLPVREIIKSVGDHVVAGEVIIGLDRKIKSMMVGSYQMNRLQYQQAKREFNRVKALYDEGAIPLSTFEQAQTGLNMARINMNNSRAVVDLPSPIDGVVTNISVSVGEMAHPGRPLATVADLSRIKASLTVSESDLDMIRLDQTIRTFCVRGECIEGKVTKVPMSAEPMTRLFSVEGVIENPAGKLRPGTLHEVEILVAERANGLAIPLDALGEEKGQQFVYVVSEQNGKLIAKVVPVKIGLILTRELEVIEGLSAGDLVVVNGQNLIEDGTLVRIHERLGVATEKAEPVASEE